MTRDYLQNTPDMYSAKATSQKIILQRPFNEQQLHKNRRCTNTLFSVLHIHCIGDCHGETFERMRNEARSFLIIIRRRCNKCRRKQRKIPIVHGIARENLFRKVMGMHRRGTRVADKRHDGLSCRNYRATLS